MRYLFICLAALLLFAAPAFADDVAVTVSVDSITTWSVVGAIDYGLVVTQWDGWLDLTGQVVDWHYCSNVNGIFHVAWAPDANWTAQTANLKILVNGAIPNAAWGVGHGPGTLGGTWPVDLSIKWPVPPLAYGGVLTFTHIP